MGRKVSQESLKISKLDHQKHQFNTLIKVLRPRVYITDSSSFKKLVQELTGNGSPATLSPPPLEPNMVENFPPFETDQAQSGPQTSPDDVSICPEEATTTTTSYSPELLCYDDALLMNKEFNQVCNQLCLDDALDFQDSLANQSIDHFLAYQNLESLLLLDVEPNPLYNCYELQPDVSIYDYELPGLLL